MHEIPKDQQNMKMPGTCEIPMWLGRGETSHLGEHDMVRRMDPHGEALVWCRKCWVVHGAVRLGPKLTRFCWPGKKGTKEFGKSCKESSSSIKEKCRRGTRAQRRGSLDHTKQGHVRSELSQLLAQGRSRSGGKGQEGQRRGCEERRRKV